MEAKANMLITTVDSDDLATKLAETLIAKRLAACVQQMPIKSHYRWQGNVQCDTEIMLFIKTSMGTVDKAIAMIEEIHSYDVPEIITMPITGGSAAYLDWINMETASP